MNPNASRLSELLNKWSIPEIWQSLWDMLARRENEKQNAIAVRHLEAGIVKELIAAAAFNGRKTTAKTTINARMIDVLGNKPESAGWTCKQWANHLHCTKAGILRTNVWKSMKPDPDRERGCNERAELLLRIWQKESAEVSELLALLPTDAAAEMPAVAAAVKPGSYSALDLAERVQRVAKAVTAKKETDTPQYVTLDQMAARVNRSKKSLEKKLNHPRSTMPRPDREGGGGKPHEWEWPNIRPWLENEYGKKLPERLPSRRADGN